MNVGAMLPPLSSERRALSQDLTRAPLLLHLGLQGRRTPHKEKLGSIRTPIMVRGSRKCQANRSRGISGQRPDARLALFGRRHQRHGVAKSAQTSARDRQAALVIVVAESSLAPPHGKLRASFNPAVVNGADVEISVRVKVRHVLPVFRKV